MQIYKHHLLFLKGLSPWSLVHIVNLIIFSSFKKITIQRHIDGDLWLMGLITIKFIILDLQLFFAVTLQNIQNKITRLIMAQLLGACIVPIHTYQSSLIEIQQKASSSQNFKLLQ